MSFVRERVSALDEVGDLAAEPGSRAWAVAVRAKLLEHLHDTESSAQALQGYREAMLRFEGFRQLTDRSGFSFRTFEAFCRERPPFGLGYDPVALDRIVEERRSAQVKAQSPATLLDPGPPTKEERMNKGDVITVNERGTSADYLTARIARDAKKNPKAGAVLKRMQAGEYPSVRAAALDAGIVKRRVSIPTDVDGAARALRRHFSPDELVQLAALLGGAA